MAPPAWLLGLELTRFAPADDAADALAGSLSAVEAGGWTLSAYEGPALQPYLGLSLGRFEVALAPAAAWRREVAESADDRTATLRTLQARGGARALGAAGPVLYGLDLALSGGRATLDRALVARGALCLEVGPTLGLRAPIGASWHLLARARWPFRLEGSELSHGLSGAVALEWRRGDRATPDEQATQSERSAPEARPGALGTR